MKKRIFSAVLILIMLLAIPSCSMDQLTEFIGKMNENVMGVDPENAAKAEEAIKDSTSKPADKENLQNTIDDIFGSEGGEASNITVPDNILASLDADAIGNLANSINKAAGAAGFGDSMEKPAANDEATKGSAELVTDIVNTVMQNDDTTIPRFDIPESDDDQDQEESGESDGLTTAQKEMLNYLIDGINQINTGKTLDNESYTPTQADAVILQMAQSVVITIANDPTIKDENGNINFDEIEPTELITTENKKMLQSAIDTINVLAPHSAFEGLNINLDSLLNSFMEGKGASNA